MRGHERGGECDEKCKETITRLEKKCQKKEKGETFIIERNGIRKQRLHKFARDSGAIRHPQFPIFIS